MEKFVISGGEKLEGTIRISGAKNAALPIIAASLLADSSIVLRNIPQVRDVEAIKNILQALGEKVSIKNHVVYMHPNSASKWEVPEDLGKALWYSILMLGSLLSKVGKARLPYPGGDRLGIRKIDLHVKGLEALGAEITVSNGWIVAQRKQLRGARVHFYFPSVSATENVMIAACLADGVTVIHNSAKEPEIVDLANFLNRMGAQISGAGTDIIRIKGVDELSGTEHTIMSDRIETGTYAVAAAITNGNILLKNTDLSLLKSVVSKLREIGVEIEEVSEGTRVSSYGKFYPVDIETGPYPGFPTDMQQIVTPLLLMADGESTIKETIFENRFNHIPELIKMGADLKINSDTIFIKGISKLKGTEVKAMEIRGGTSLVLAGLIAKGKTTINGVHHIFRGYENLLSKLKNVGANCNLITIRE